MPLVTITLRQGRPKKLIRAISDAAHRALVQIVGIPEGDRFHLIHDLEPSRIIYDPTYLGITRTEDIVFIQITLRAGRSRETRVSLHRRLAELLEEAGIRRQDVVIVLTENDYADWSVGNGDAPLMSLLAHQSTG